LLYASHNDFQQTNAVQSFISEGTQGVTESLKGRMILPITGSYGQFIHVLTHENGTCNKPHSRCCKIPIQSARQSTPGRCNAKGGSK